MARAHQLPGKVIENNYIAREIGDTIPVSTSISFVNLKLSSIRFIATGIKSSTATITATHILAPPNPHHFKCGTVCLHELISTVDENARADY
jgi:hypothetical protein